MDKNKRKSVKVEKISKYRKKSEIFFKNQKILKKNHNNILGFEK